jgi:hypothetical protein
MLSRRTILIAFAAILPATATNVAFAQTHHPDSPAGIVEAFMKQYATDGMPEPPYTPAVANRLRNKDLEEDFIVGGNDSDVKNVRVKEVTLGMNYMVIEARFTNFGKQRVVLFDFRAVDGKWGIANVNVGNNFDLRRMLGLAPLPAW